MPRNEPSSTKFEKYDRWTMLAPSQRMRTSSRKSINPLAERSRYRTDMLRTLPPDRRWHQTPAGADQIARMASEGSVPVNRLAAASRSAGTSR
jgi:hypothetical protein